MKFFVDTADTKEIRELAATGLVDGVTTNPTLVPVIALDNAPFGTAAGAPRVARVGDADSIVSLFNSAASREGGLLAQTTDAELFDSSYKALLSLDAAAGRRAAAASPLRAAARAELTRLRRPAHGDGRARRRRPRRAR